MTPDEDVVSLPLPLLRELCARLDRAAPSFDPELTAVVRAWQRQPPAARQPAAAGFLSGPLPPAPAGGG